MTDRPIIQEAQGISWQRLGMTAAGVAGTVLIVDAIFNRETRDALSFSERSYLNSSFQYTGAGLAITAVAARSMFKSGYAFRIMTANPCRFLVSTQIYTNPFIRGSSWSQSCWLDRVYDGCFLYAAGKDSAEAPLLVCMSSLLTGTNNY